MLLKVLICLTLVLSAVSAEESSNVAFTAGISSGQNIAGSQTVVYTNTFTNHGAGYDNQTGVFTVPEGGLYLFAFYAVTQSNSQVWIQLFKNDEYQVSAYAHSSTDSVTGGNVAVLRLLKGDTVSIKTYRATSFSGSSAVVSVTFSGALLGVLA